VTRLAFVSLALACEFAVLGAARAGSQEASQLIDEAVEQHGNGHYRPAYETYLRALYLLTDPRDDPDALFCSLNASSLAADLGEYAASRDLATRALGLAEGLKDEEAKGRAHNNLGRALQFLGDNESAIEAYRKALDINLAGEDGEGIATNLANIGVVLFNQGRYADALEAYDRAAAAAAAARPDEPWSRELALLVAANRAAVHEKLGEPEIALGLYRVIIALESSPPREVAHALTGLGRVLLELSDPHAALEAFERAARMHRESGDSGAESNVLLHMGATLCEALGSHAEARSRFSAALEIAARIGDRNEALFDLLYAGRCHLHSGDPPGARERFEEAEGIARELISTEGLWSARFGLGRVAAAAGSRDRALELHLEALEIIESTRDELVLSEHRAGFLEGRHEVWAATVDLALGDSFAPRSESIARAFEIADRFRARSLLDRMGGAPVGLAETQAVLGADEALVEYVVGEIRVKGFVVTRNESFAFSGPSSKDLAARVADASRGRFHPAAGGSEPAAAALASELLESAVRAMPPSVRILRIVPDGALFDLSFGALPLRGEPVLARYAVATVPSAAVLVTIRRRPDVDSGGPSLAAIGNPTLSAAGDRGRDGRPPSSRDVLIERHGLSPITRSGEEIRRVAELVPGSAAVREGADATVAEFFRLLRSRPRVLHVAAHTIAGDGEPGAIVLFPDGDEGIVLAEEVERLAASANLVVLSSCRSGRGRARRGEGVVGFASAFLASGADTVLATLAQVADETSPVVMEGFYRRLAAGEPPIEALRLTQLSFLTGPDGEAAAPHVMPYVLVGDGGLGIFDRGRAAKWVAAAAVGLLTAAAVFLLARRRNPG